MFDGLISELDPPANRRGKCDGDKELHFTEAAVMLAYGMHLLATVPQLNSVELHPDGEHGKRFEIAKWLSERGFALTEPQGRTSYCGKYVYGDKSILVTLKPGKGGVNANTPEGAFTAECKGGFVNTRHPGQVSCLRKGLCEAVGLLMARDLGGKKIAVVHYTPITLRLAQKMVPRATAAGIQIDWLTGEGKLSTLERTPGVRHQARCESARTQTLSSVPSSYGFTAWTK